MRGNRKGLSKKEVESGVSGICEGNMRGPHEKKGEVKGECERG